MDSLPVLNHNGTRLYSIPGKVPNPINMPNYCYFRDRCNQRIQGTCDGPYPEEISISATHKVSCYHYCEADQLRKAGQEEAARLKFEEELKLVQKSDGIQSALRGKED